MTSVQTEICRKHIFIFPSFLTFGLDFAAYRNFECPTCAHHLETENIWTYPCWLLRFVIYEWKSHICSILLVTVSLMADKNYRESTNTDSQILISMNDWWCNVKVGGLDSRSTLAWLFSFICVANVTWTFTVWTGACLSPQHQPLHSSVSGERCGPDSSRRWWTLGNFF